MYFKPNIKLSSRGSTAHGRGDKATLGRAGRGEHCFLQRTGNEPQRVHERDLKTNADQQGGGFSAHLPAALPRGRQQKLLLQPGGGSEGVDLGTPRVLGVLGGCEAKKGPDEPGFTLGTWLQPDSIILKVFLNPAKISDPMTRGDAISMDRALRGCSGPCTQTHRGLPAPAVPSSHLVLTASAQLPPATVLGNSGGAP